MLNKTAKCKKRQGIIFPVSGHSYNKLKTVPKAAFMAAEFARANALANSQREPK